MNAYKILQYEKKTKTFLSPVTLSIWKNGCMEAKKNLPVHEHTGWIWACDRPDNEELENYINVHNPVLVELSLYGEIIINDNGVIQAEYAEIKCISIDNPLGAYLYAKTFGGNDLLREIASKSSRFALYYARVLDKKRHKVTLESACKDPTLSILYALYVDKKPTDYTREQASKDPFSAYVYARDVDKKFHKVTYEGSCKNILTKKLYESLFSL